jgi:gamma-glutamyl hercynylcysteine S-oxide hydrolase
MCRLLAYWGPPRSAATLVLDPPHSLRDQVTHAREQSSGAVNPDGWGITWTDPELGPQLHRTTEPLSSDPQADARLRGIVTRRFVAHIRHKSPGSVTDITGNAPFQSAGGDWQFAHNGFVPDFHDGVAVELTGELSPERRSEVQGDTDSEVLFALILDRLDAGVVPSRAVADTITDVAGRFGGRYNVVLVGRDTLVATRWDNSLHLRRDRPEPGAVVIASEPYDGGADWQTVPDHSIVVLDGADVITTPLDPPREEAAS